MNVEVVDVDKSTVEIHVDSSTVAEVVRVYLNDKGVKFAAWRREHPEKPLVFRVEASSGTPKKAIVDAVAAIKKDTDAVLKILK